MKCSLFDSKNEYDDLTGCIVESLNGGFGDYCYSMKQVERVKQRLHKYGRKSMLFKKVTNDYTTYYHLIPINCYKQYNDSNMSLKGLTFNADNLKQFDNDRYKFTFMMNNTEVDLKEFGRGIDSDTLNSVIAYTNYMNW